VVAAGLTLDLIVVVPLAYYLLIVRRRGVPVVTLAPVVVLSVLAAGWILPPEHQKPLRILEVLAVPLELGVIGWVGWRAARAFRRARRDDALDPIERLRRAAFEVTRNDRAAAVLAMEAAVFYYAIGSWWARPHAPAGALVKERPSLNLAAPAPRARGRLRVPASSPQRARQDRRRLAPPPRLRGDSPAPPALDVECRRRVARHRHHPL